MKNFLKNSLLALSLLVAAMPALAQKNTKASAEKNVFYGQIDYVTKGQNKPASETKASANANKAPRTSRETVLDVVSQSSGSRLSFVLSMFSDPKMVTVDLKSVRLSLGGDGSVLNLFLKDNAAAWMGEMPVSKLYGIDVANIKNIASLMAKKDYANAQSKMQLLYKRTGATKTICDLTCAEYTVLKGQLAGKSVWVCEDYVLPHFMAPYWGMIFPVLEAEFYLPVEPQNFFPVCAAKVSFDASQAQRNAMLDKPVEIHPIEEILDILAADPARFIN